MEAQKFIDLLFEEAQKQGLQEYQAKYHRWSSSDLSMYERKIQDLNNDETQMLHFEVKQDGKIGEVFCKVLEAEMIPQIVCEAVENSRIIDDKDERFFFDGKAEYKKVEPYAPLEKDIDKEQFLIALEELAYAENPLVNKVIDTFFSEAEREEIIRNSLGLNLYSKRTKTEAGIYLSVKKGEEVKDASEQVDFSREEDFDPAALAKRAVAKAVAKLDGVEADSGKKTVVIDNKTFRVFLGKLLEAVNAKMVQQKFSQWSGKLGQKVANEKVTVIEDPFRKGSWGTIAFDKEGYPSQYKEIIASGVLQTYLHNLQTAHKDNVTPTGNGAGSGIMCSNLFLQPRDSSLDDLLMQMDNGILVNGLSGLNVGFDLISGDFSFVGAGFKVTNGNKQEALQPFTLSGNFYNLWHDIREVGNDLYFYRSNIGTPSVLIDNLTVSGK